MESLNALSPLEIIPTEVWELIFGKLAEPQDLLSCRVTNKVWKNILDETEKARFMFPMVFKLIHKYLKKQDINICRLVCHSWKIGVDRCPDTVDLIGTFKLRHFGFEEFLKKFDSVFANGSGMVFKEKLVEVRLFDFTLSGQYDLSYESHLVWYKYGKYVENLRIIITSLIETDQEYLVIVRHLNEILGRTPNLKKLQLWGELEDFTAYQPLEETEYTLFADLPYLMELDFWKCEWPILTMILKKYWTLKQDQNLVRKAPAITLNKLTCKYRNQLQSITSNFTCPQVKELEICRTCDDPDYKFLAVPSKLFEKLNGFCGMTLEKLTLHYLHDKELLMLPNKELLLPNLKVLRIHFIPNRDFAWDWCRPPHVIRYALFFESTLSQLRSLEKLDICIDHDHYKPPLYGMVGHRDCLRHSHDNLGSSETDVKGIQVFGYLCQMYKSNIWKVLPSLKNIQVEWYKDEWYMYQMNKPYQVRKYSRDMYDYINSKASPRTPPGCKLDTQPALNSDEIKNVLLELTRSLDKLKNMESKVERNKPPHLAVAVDKLESAIQEMENYLK